MYRVNIRETGSRECYTYWLPALTLDAFKAMKAQLVAQAAFYGCEHELTLTEETPRTDTHWLNATSERVITKIRTGANDIERLFR